MSIRRFLQATTLPTALLLATVPANATNVVVQHNDNNRTGANTSETTLKPSNVNVNNFGKIFSHSVDGKVYAQPLYVGGLTVNGGTHNVVYVCTDHNSLYALDADTGSQLWHDNFGTPVPNSDVGGCGDMSPDIGITGTPVIDTGLNALYVDARTLISGAYAHKLHAISLTTGGELFGGPVTISASVNGKNFNPHYQHQRPGLVIVNGVVYIGFGSDCDANTYYGWLLGYNETSLSRTAEFCVTPSGSEGAIWSSGQAPAVDSSGNIYVMTANGSFNNSGSNPNYSESFLKLSTPGLSVESYFTPMNQSSLSSSDEDLGAGGPVLLPGTSLVVGVGKQGLAYLCNTASLGGYSSSANNIVQTLQIFSETDHVGQNPVYWQGPSHAYLYFSAGGSKTKVYAFNGSTISTSAVAQSSETQGTACGGLSISANGTSDGILWVTDSGSGGTLRAYNADASSSFSELWNSQNNSSRDSLGTYNKFVSPTIANGKVYVGTAGKLVAYGELSGGGSTNNFPGIYQIQNEASGLVLNNQGRTTNGSPITQWSSASSANLEWTFIPTSNGYYQINSVKSGLDAVVQSASTSPGAGIIQWSFGSAGNDQWKPTANSDGSYTFYNLKSGLVLGDPGSSTSTSTQMDQETYTGASNQKWKLLLQ